MKALAKKMALMKGWMEDCEVERWSYTVLIYTISVERL
jgi:hypothetical protein